MKTSPISPIEKSHASKEEVLSYINGKRPSLFLHILIIITITLAAIAVTIFLSQKDYREITRSATEQFNKQQLILVRSVAAGIETFIADVNNDMLALSTLPVVQRMEPGILDQMKVIYETFPPETSSRRLDKNGVLRFIYPNENWRKTLIGRDYSREAWFQKAKETGRVVISGLIINEMGERRIRVARPVYVENEKGAKEFNGVIICSFDPKTLANIFISPIISGETGYAWMLNKEGIFLAHHEKEFVGRDACAVRMETNPDLSYDAINNIQQKMMAGEEGTGRYVSGWHREHKGETEKLIAYTPVHVFDKTWSVAVCAPAGEVERITSKIHRNHLYTLVFIILILVSGGVFFFIVFYRRAQSLQREIEIHKRAEEALKKSQRYTRGLIETSPDALMTISSEGKITDVNHATELITGVSSEEIIGTDFSNYFTDPDTAREGYQQVFRDGYLRDYALEIKHRDGRITPVFCNASAYKDTQGQVTGVFAAARDMTEIRQAEEKLKEYSENLEGMIEERTRALNQALNDTEEERNKINGILKSIADGLIVTDTHNNIILMNQAGEDLLGVRLSEVIDRPIDFAIEDKTLREKIRYTFNKKTTGYQFDFELPGDDPKHSRILRGRTSVIYDKNGEEIGIVMIIHDVTHEREVDMMKTEFVSTAAHELRTPLTSIQGFSEILLTRDNITDEERKKFLSYINTQAVTLAEIVNDLLNISRIESEQGFTLSKEQCEADEIIKHVISQFQDIFQKHRFEVVLTDKHVKLFMDKEKMEQVLNNILSNAVKYSPEGGVIRVVGEVSENCYQVSVEDRGIGMSPEQVKKIFDKFYRSDVSDSAPEGTGLGMTIVKYIVEAHQGKVWVDSGLGNGTAVRFTIPIQDKGKQAHDQKNNGS